MPQILVVPFVMDLEGLITMINLGNHTLIPRLRFREKDLDRVPHRERNGALPRDCRVRAIVTVAAEIWFTVGILDVIHVRNGSVSIDVVGDGNRGRNVDVVAPLQSQQV